jgi:hypothetical protein
MLPLTKPMGATANSATAAMRAYVRIISSHLLLSEALPLPALAPTLALGILGLACAVERKLKKSLRLIMLTRPPSEHRLPLLSDRGPPT